MNVSLCLLTLGDKYTHMKPGVQNGFSFIAKSMLWSLLFYVIVMFAFNWDDVVNRIHGVHAVAKVISELPQLPAAPDKTVTTAPAISTHSDLIRHILLIVRSIHHVSGMALR